MPLRLQISITAVLAAVLLAGWFLWTGGTEVAQSSETPKTGSAGTKVLVEPISLIADKTTVRAIGTGQALKSASIYPSVAGEVIQVNFRAGQRVSKGLALVRLDDKHQRLAVRLAQVAVKEARSQAERLEKLAPSGAASQARLETAQTTLESAIVRLDQAKAALQDRTVFAPFDGVIGLTDIERGDRVSETTLITTLDDRSSILVDFNLPEEYARDIKVGDPLTVRPWTMPDKVLAGVVDATGSRIDPASRTLRVKARIPNPDDVIRPGTSFEVSVAFKGKPYPSVREVAVMWSRDGAYIWRVDDKRAEKVYVKIVRRDEGKTLVDGPLKAGDVIVVEGVQGLRAGQRLDARPFAESEAAEPKRRKRKDKDKS